MPGEDTPPNPVRARRDGDHAAATDMLVDELRATRRELRQGFEAVQHRLAKGDTTIALIEERQGNQGTSIASLIRRFDALERETRALACDKCEERIDALERWTDARDVAEEAVEKRRTWQPQWWLMLLATAAFGVLTAIVTKRLGG
jgi:uncharacterized coiled-coil DUF342 family protein